MGDTLFCEEFVCFLNIQLRTNRVHILFSPFSAFTCMQFAKFYSFNLMDALSFFFMPPPRRAPEALCFRVVRPSVRTRISLTRNLKNPLVDFHHTWPRGAPWRVDELIRFWARSAQGQRSKVNELGLNMLFLPRFNTKSQEPLGGFSSNLVQGCDTRSRWTD